MLVFPSGLLRRGAAAQRRGVRLGLRCVTTTPTSRSSGPAAVSSSAAPSLKNDDGSAKSSSVLQRLATQTNGFKHGSTIYSVLGSDGSDTGDDKGRDAFVVKKTQEHVVQLWKQSATPISSERAFLEQVSERVVDTLADLFLPRDARKSVTKDYFPYAKWYFFGAIASTASGVLSMQSLLYAIGLGAGSIPTAAAVNWVLKDGLGQFGGVMFARCVHSAHDRCCCN